MRQQIVRPVESRHCLSNVHAWMSANCIGMHDISSALPAMSLHREPFGVSRDRFILFVSFVGKNSTSNGRTKAEGPAYNFARLSMLGTVKSDAIARRI